MRVLAVFVVPALATITLFSVPPTAGGESTASRIVDRTLSCPVGARAGVRAVTVRGQAGVRDIEDRSKWKFLASAMVSDVYAPFAGVNAGNPVADLAPGVPARPERLWIATGPTCRSAARIPFTRSGLSRASAGQLGNSYDCRPGNRVLVRVRGVFRSPTSLRVRRLPHGITRLVASGTIREGFLAVHSAAGKPLAYAQVFESGRVNLFTARSCVED
jgi:hypothetical protein